MATSLRVLHDPINLCQVDQERFQAGQGQCVGPVTERPRGVLVNFHENSVNTCCESSSSKILNELRLSARHRTLAARQLQAVSGIENHGIPELAHHRKRANVDNQIIIAKR